MKTLRILTILCLTTSQLVFAQSADDKQKEKRVRDFHKILAVDDRDEWRKFIKENFTQAFMERQMKARTTVDGASSSSSEAKPADPMAAKLNMFQRLHDDFAQSTIKAVTVQGDVATMNVTDDGGMAGTFKFTFTKSAPYLIDMMGIQLER